MDLLLGPVFNRDGDGVVTRHVLVRTLSSLFDLCEEGSQERQWAYARIREVSDVLSLDDQAREGLRSSLGKVLKRDDGVAAVRELLFGTEVPSSGESRGDPDSGVGLSWADEMDYVDKIADLEEKLTDMSEQLKREADRVDAVTLCGDEFVRQISDVRSGLAEMVRKWEDRLHSITKPGDALFHSPHGGGYADDSTDSEVERPCFIPEHEFGRLSTRCTCTLGLNMQQHVERMIKVRAVYCTRGAGFHSQ